MNWKDTFKKNLLNYLLSVLSIVALILVWSWFSKRNNAFLPTPGQVGSKFITSFYKPIGSVTMVGHTLASLKRVFGGLLCAALAGIPFGTLIGWNRLARAVLQPLFELIRPIPPLAWVPLLTVWFGIGETPKIMLVFLATLVPIVVNTYSGVNLAQKDNIAVGKVFGARGTRLLFDIVMPSALPSIMAGLKVSLTLAFAVVLAAEMISAKSGLGMLIMRGSEGGDIALTMVAMLIIGIIGALTSALFTIIERKLSPWRTDLH